jgi:hypothetical protein
MPEFKKINKEPKPPKKKKEKKVPPKTYLFWLKSNRGTNEKAIYELPGNYNEDLIQDSLETWCSYFAAWTQSICNYGWKEIKVLPKEKLKIEWDKVCKEKAKIQDKWDTLRAMFSVRKNQ